MKKICQDRKAETGEEGKLLFFLFIFFAVFCLSSTAPCSPVVMHKIVYRHASDKSDDVQNHKGVAKETNKKTGVSKSQMSVPSSNVKKGQEPFKKGERHVSDIVKQQGSKQEKYVFKAEGKRDPFLPFFIEKDTNFNMKSPMGLFSAETELERIKMSDLKLVSVVKSQNNVWAMVRGPDGKGYILKKGVGIGTRGGKVDKIIWENRMTPLGEKEIRKVVIKEPVIKAGGKVEYRFVDMKFGDGSGDKQ